MSYRELFLDLSDLRLHCLTWGSPKNPPVLLLHGYLDIAHTWRVLADALSDDYYLVAPDFRGHGDSDWTPGYSYLMMNYVNDFFELVDALGWDCFSLVGHSMGANCASLMAGTLPERIERLVMIEGFGVPFLEPCDAPERLAKLVKERKALRQEPSRKPHNKQERSGLIPKGVARRFKCFDDVVARLEKTNGYAPELARELAQYGSKERGDGTWTWKFDPAVRFTNPLMYLPSQFQAFWSRIQAPTLHIVGNESPFVAMASDDLWSMPDSRVAHVADARHAVHHDAPLKTQTLVRDFLKEG